MSAIRNRLKAPCEKCGSPAVVEVVPDGFDDAPTTFTITRSCGGGCNKTYLPVTAAQMAELTGLPLTGWSPD